MVLGEPSPSRVTERAMETHKPEGNVLSHGGNEVQQARDHADHRSRADGVSGRGGDHPADREHLAPREAGAGADLPDRDQPPAAIRGEVAEGAQTPLARRSARRGEAAAAIWAS